MTTSSKRRDLGRLVEIAEAIAALEPLYREREAIWVRRLGAGDTKQVELVKASAVDKSQVNRVALAVARQRERPST